MPNFIVLALYLLLPPGHRTCIRHSQNTLDVFWKSYLCSIYVLSPGGTYLYLFLFFWEISRELFKAANRKGVLFDHCITFSGLNMRNGMCESPLYSSTKFVNMNLLTWQNAVLVSIFLSTGNISSKFETYFFQITLIRSNMLNLLWPPMY